MRLQTLVGCLLRSPALRFDPLPFRRKRQHQVLLLMDRSSETFPLRFRLSRRCLLRLFRIRCLLAGNLCALFKFFCSFQPLLFGLLDLFAQRLRP